MRASSTSRTTAWIAFDLRLRPILMTSFAFILGVVPLVLAKGAGAEMRVALGVAVFAGMIGVTTCGLFFTPVFYNVTWFTEGRTPRPSVPAQPATPSVSTPPSPALPASGEHA